MGPAALLEMTSYGNPTKPVYGAALSGFDKCPPSPTQKLDKGNLNYEHNRHKRKRVINPQFTVLEKTT